MSDPAAPTIFPVILNVPADKRLLTGREKVQYLSAFAREAAAHSAEMAGIRFGDPEKDEHGVPVPVDGVYWSVSHKPEVVAGVVAPGRVGIDLERIKPVHDGLFRRIADSGEWERYDGDRLEGLFHFWTAKEAVLKATGVGFKGMSRCRITRWFDGNRCRVTFDDSSWDVEYFRFSHYLAAVASSGLSVAWNSP